MYPDLSAPIRTAIVGSAEITALLEAYRGSYPVFTRKPIPEDAPSIVVLVSQNITSAAEDGINDLRPVITRTVTVTGSNPTDWRTVDQIARLIARHFHRKRLSITVTGWDVIDVRASLQGGAATDLDQNVSMVVTLAIRLAAAAA